jgi:hypothetical protein
VKTELSCDTYDMKAGTIILACASVHDRNFGKSVGVVREVHKSGKPTLRPQKAIRKGCAFYLGIHQPRTIINCKEADHLGLRRNALQVVKT